MGTCLAECRGITLLLQTSHGSLPEEVFLQKATQHSRTLFRTLESQPLDLGSATSCVDVINSGPWPMSIKSALVSSIMDKCSSGCGASSAVANAKTQGTSNPEAFFTEKQWAFLRDQRNTTRSKIQLAVGHILELGIRNPSEKLAQAITGIVLAAHYENPVESTSAHQRFCMNLDVKSTFKTLSKKWGFRSERVASYTTPEHLRANHPEIWSRVFCDVPPTTCPFQELSMVVTIVPMRKSNIDIHVAGRNAKMSSSGCNFEGVAMQFMNLLGNLVSKQDAPPHAFKVMQQSMPTPTMPPTPAFSLPPSTSLDEAGVVSRGGQGQGRQLAIADGSSQGAALEATTPGQPSGEQDVDDVIKKLREETTKESGKSGKSASSKGEKISRKRPAASMSRANEDLPECPFNYRGGVIYSDGVSGRWRIYTTKGDRIDKTIAWGQDKHESWKKAVRMLDIKKGK